MAKHVVGVYIKTGRINPFVLSAPFDKLRSNGSSRSMNAPFDWFVPHRSGRTEYSLRVDNLRRIGGMCMNINTVHTEREAVEV